MRAELADTALTRYAGRFVWLELNFDSPANKDFLARRSIVATPTLLVLDPADERATATHLGGLARAEFMRFLDLGARGVGAHAVSPADSALARGEAHLGLGQLDAAIASYREALRLSDPSWPHRERAVTQLVRALHAHGDAEAGATLASAEAPHMARSPALAQVVDPGLACAIRGRDAPWASPARKALAPLAAAALDIPGVDPDTRNQLYMSLVADAQMRGDSATASHWGARYQHDLEAFVPRNDDERTGLDIACVEAADYVPHPERFVPALEASERAMPTNYVPSLRLAQLLLAVEKYDDALAACDRGLRHVDGPLGRTWLLELKAQALIGKGDQAGAQRVLATARESAVAINTPTNRDNNLRRIDALMQQAGGAAR